MFYLWGVSGSVCTIPSRRGVRFIVELFNLTSVLKIVTEKTNNKTIDHYVFSEIGRRMTRNFVHRRQVIASFWLNGVLLDTTCQTRAPGVNEGRDSGWPGRKIPLIIAVLSLFPQRKNNFGAIQVFPGWWPPNNYAINFDWLYNYPSFYDISHLLASKIRQAQPALVIVYV